MSENYNTRLRTRLAHALEGLRYAHAADFPYSDLELVTLTFGARLAEAFNQPFVVAVPEHQLPASAPEHNLFRAMTFAREVQYWTLEKESTCKLFNFWVSHAKPTPCPDMSDRRPFPVGLRPPTHPKYGFCIPDNPKHPLLTRWLEGAQAIEEDVDTAQQVIYRLASKPWAAVCRHFPDIASLVDPDVKAYKFGRKANDGWYRKTMASECHQYGEQYFDQKLYPLVTKAIMLDDPKRSNDLRCWVQ